jgi:serine phosphatase RsbU (regulator of sigma subunit)/transcriptional regulator with GAF, ATPase, and Fis domain
MDDPRARRAALIGLAWCAGVTLAGGTVWQHPAIAALLVMSPLIAAAFAGARMTGGVGAVATLMAFTLSWSGRSTNTTGTVLLITSVVLASVAATVVAFLRQRSDDRLVEARQREEDERQRRMDVESRARAAVLTAGLASADEPAQVAGVVFAAAREEVGADAGLLSLLTERETLRATAQFGYRDGVIDRWGEVALTPDQPATHVIERGEPIWAESLETFVTQWPAVGPTAVRNGHRSMAVLPLRGAGGPIGVVAFSFAHPRPFTPSLRTLLTALAEEAARALERSRMAAINAEDVATAIRLERLSAALLGAATPEEVARATVLKGMAAADAASGVLRVPTADGYAMDCLWLEGSSLPSARQPMVIFGTPAGDAITGGQPLWFESRAAAEARYPAWRGLVSDITPGRMAYLPLRARDEVIGVLAFGFEESGPFNVFDERLLEALADQCAAALDRAQLFTRERTAREDAEHAHELLTLLSDVTRLLITSLDPDAVIEQLVHLVTDRFANACVVLLPGENGLHRALTGGHGQQGVEVARQDGDEPDVPFDSDAPAAVAYRTGLPQTVGVTEDMRARARRIGAPEVPEGSVTALAVPLPAHGGGTLGVMTFMGARGRAGFGPDEITLAVEVAARAGLALHNARAYTHEHGVAETLQRAVLPRRLAALDGLALSAEYRPGVAGTSAGGDWYDTVALTDGRVYFSVGDVMGKGTAAAALMGQVRAAMRAYAAIDPSPAAVLDRMDALFDTLDEHRLVTAVVGTVEQSTGEVRLASAGHPAPVVVDRRGGVRLIEGGGSLVLGTGLLRRGTGVRARREHRFMLEPGDTLVLFSDGLLERRGEHISIGFDRLAEAVAEMRGDPGNRSQPPAARLVDLLSGGSEIEDDVVVLTIHLPAPGEAVAVSGGPREPATAPSANGDGAVRGSLDVSDPAITGMSRDATVGTTGSGPPAAAEPVPAVSGVVAANGGADLQERGRHMTGVGEATRAEVRTSPLASSLRLPPAIGSTPVARHWVADLLADLPREVVETTVLLTSELVTNAVLHAGTPLVVTIHRLSDRIRVDVSDASSDSPMVRAFGVGATTGRGLMLLDLLPSDWGVQEVPGGKVVWFELPVDVPVDPPMPAVHGQHRLESRLPSMPRPDRFEGRETFVLQLLDTPVALMQRTTEQYESLFREFRLIAERDPEDSQAVPRRLLELIGALGTQNTGFGVPSSRQWRAAVESGQARVDLRMRLPLQSAQACEIYSQMLDEADMHCRAAELITLPTEPDCVALRRWVLRETARQAAGLAPERWNGDPAASRLAG